MLIDASSYKNLEILDLIDYIKNLDKVETVKQVAEEMEMRVQRVHEVTDDELNQLIRYLELIAEHTDKIISAEIAKDNKLSITHTFNPRGSKAKISLHYGELYLLAKAISIKETILCDDESIFHIKIILSGICDIELDAKRTIEYLYSMYIANNISATDFIKYFERLTDRGLLQFRFPAKSIKDKSVTKTLIEFMYQLESRSTR